MVALPSLRFFAGPFAHTYQLVFGEELLGAAHWQRDKHLLTLRQACCARELEVWLTTPQVGVLQTVCSCPEVPDRVVTSSYLDVTPEFQWPEALHGLFLPFSDELQAHVYADYLLAGLASLEEGRFASLVELVDGEASKGQTYDIMEDLANRKWLELHSQLQDALQAVGLV